MVKFQVEIFWYCDILLSSVGHYGTVIGKTNEKEGEKISTAMMTEGYSYAASIKALHTIPMSLLKGMKCSLKEFPIVIIMYSDGYYT